MQTAQRDRRVGSSGAWRDTLQLAGAHALVGLLAGAVLLRALGSPPPWTQVLLLLALLTLASGVLGWFLTHNIRSELGHLRELARWAEGPEQREWALQQAREAGEQQLRERLARDLHDSLKQQIVGMSFSAAAALARWESDPVGAHSALEAISRSTQEAQVEMNVLLLELRPQPLDSAGLLAALREQCEALGYRTGAHVTVELDDAPPADQLPAGAPEAIFRIAQEALSNVARHARARNVSLRLRQEGDDWTLTIHDDGQGFAPGSQQMGTGLAGLRERTLALGGRADVVSAPGKGVTLAVHIPLKVRGDAMETEQSLRQAYGASEAQRGRNAQQLAEGALGIGGILLLLAAPFWSVALATGIAVGAVIGAWAARRAVARLRGAQDAQAQWLHQTTYDVASGVALLVGFCVWYLPVAAPTLLTTVSSDIIWYATLAGVALCAALTVTLALIGYRLAGRYYAALPIGQRMREIGQRRTRLYSTFALWVIIVVIAIATTTQLHLAAPATSFASWNDDTAVALLAAWLLFLGVEWLALLGWQRLIARAINRSQAI